MNNTINNNEWVKQHVAQRRVVLTETESKCGKEASELKGRKLAGVEILANYITSPV